MPESASICARNLRFGFGVVASKHREAYVGYGPSIDRSCVLRYCGIVCMYGPHNLECVPLGIALNLTCVPCRYNLVPMVLATPSVRSLDNLATSEICAVAASSLTNIYSQPQNGQTGRLMQIDSSIYVQGRSFGVLCRVTYRPSDSDQLLEV